jgi:alkylation response protein AidB-like acyl-CoA dehydrogenase
VRENRDLTEDQQELVRALTKLCESHAGGPTDEAWRALEDMGILALGTPEGGGGAAEVTVAMRVLGGAAFAGPLVAATNPALADIAIAAYLCGAAGALIDQAAAYARDRRQFGRPIGAFQAVAFPLADAYVRTTAATQLTSDAAATIDTADTDGPSAATARLSARRAALLAVHTCHQVYGAISYTTESPMAALRARVAEYVLMT